MRNFQEFVPVVLRFEGRGLNTPEQRCVVENAGRGQIDSNEWSEDGNCTVLRTTNKMKTWSMRKMSGIALAFVSSANWRGSYYSRHSIGNRRLINT